jgi:signal transduction histidine kinase
MVHVDVTARDGSLQVSVRDDGVGGALAGRGSGLLGLNDRVEALGGTISVTSPSGRGTVLSVELPISARTSS